MRESQNRKAATFRASVASTLFGTLFGSPPAQSRDSGSGSEPATASASRASASQRASSWLTWCISASAAQSPASTWARASSNLARTPQSRAASPFSWPRRARSWAARGAAALPSPGPSSGETCGARDGQAEAMAIRMAMPCHAMGGRCLQPPQEQGGCPVLEKKPSQE